jgi:hypothetical protein
VKTACKVARSRDHKDAGRKNGHLQQHAAPPEGGPFERKGQPPLEVDEQAHLHKNATENKNQVRNGTLVFRKFHVNLSSVGPKVRSFVYFFLNTL